MAILVIARHNGGYVLRLMGYQALLATVLEPSIESHSLGLFRDEAHCTAYLRDTIGIAPHRIPGSLRKLSSHAVDVQLLKLSMPEAKRVIEQGYPT